MNTIMSPLTSHHMPIELPLCPQHVHIVLPLFPH